MYMMSSYVRSHYVMFVCSLQMSALVTSCLTFDLQADLVLSLSQDAVGHTGVGALVLYSGTSDLQGAVDVNTVLTAIQPTALSVLKPKHRENTITIIGVRRCQYFWM